MSVDAAPSVSVLTPSFNQSRWLADNLRSVQRQTHRGIEHIVMDGGSTDGSVELLREAGPHVRWWSEPDHGQSHAINKAFVESRGEILGWLNSDDAYFACDVVENVAAVFDARPDVDVVFGHAVLVDAAGRVLQVLWVPPYRRSLHELGSFIVQPAAFVRRAALEAGLVDEQFDYTMDRELWLRLARQGRRFHRLNRVLAIDRHHAARKSYTHVATGRADNAVLVETYGIPSGELASARRKVAKIAFRMAGITRIPEVMRCELAFDGQRDGWMRLAARQILVPRAWMRNDGTAR